jgi:hypothetical protein
MQVTSWEVQAESHVPCSGCVVQADGCWKEGGCRRLGVHLRGYG